MGEFAACQGFWFLNNHVTTAVPKAATADGVSVLRLKLPFDEAPPLHVHHAEDEIFHVVQGEARFGIGSRTVTARGGDTVLAPRGIPHGFRVMFPDGAEVLTVTHGGFKEMARPAKRDTLPDLHMPTAKVKNAARRDLPRRPVRTSDRLMSPRRFCFRRCACPTSSMRWVRGWTSFLPCPIFAVRMDRR